MPYNCDHANNRSQRVACCLSHRSGIFTIFHAQTLK
jgi:hypothetical protein